MPVLVEAGGDPRVRPVPALSGALGAIGFKWRPACSCGQVCGRERARRHPGRSVSAGRLSDVTVHY